MGAYLRPLQKTIPLVPYFKKIISSLRTFMAAKQAFSTTIEHPKALLVGVYSQHNQIGNADYYYEEFLSLINTLGIHYDHTHFMKLRSADNNMFLTKGKLEEVIRVCSEHKIQKAYFSTLLSPLQERNLEKALGCDVLDRERIILEIFKKSAHTAEGKVQIEMAEIDYLKTRIIGRGRELAQQAGFIGNKGPGETLKEELKRIFADKLRLAQKHMATLERSRAVQRKQRLENKIPLFCIIGYTNAGKSSLLNRIAKGDVLAENKLFATLDTTTRELFIAKKKKGLISDTVGFISELPHNLIGAFKATLDELKFATLLIHVIDVSNPAWRSQIDVVHATLKEIDVEQPMLYVFNKIDKVGDLEQEVLLKEIKAYQPHVVIHTLTKEGIIPLVDFLETYSVE
jgi:GTPase